MSKNNKSDLHSQIKNKVGKLDIADDSGFVNLDCDTSVVSKSNGNTAITAGEYAQYKLDKQSGKIIEHSLDKLETTVIKHLKARDININNHKFNNQLIELTDYRDVNGNTIGGITVNGTVLVKTWEPNLQKWVLIRRPISTPMFSNTLNIPTTPEQMEIDLKILEDIRKYYIEKNNEKEK